jgi:hypothetical protein
MPFHIEATEHSTSDGYKELFLKFNNTWAEFDERFNLTF